MLRGVSCFKTTHIDILNLSITLRVSDAVEMKSSSGMGVYEGLMESFNASNICYTAFDNDKDTASPIAIFGFTDIDEVGVVWMMASEGAFDTFKMQKALVGLGKTFIAECLGLNPRLVNYTDSRNGAHLRLLKHLGATFYEPVPWGVEGRLFVPFEFKQEDYIYV